MIMKSSEISVTKLSLVILCLVVLLSQTVDCCNTDQFLTNETYVLKSPYYPNDYPPNRVCTYLFRTSSDYKLRIKFTAFWLESGNDYGVCSFDFVQIFDGGNEYEPMFGTFCGNDIPPTIVTTGQKLFVNFRADQSIQSFGFRATVMAVTLNYREPLPTPEPGSCSTILRQTGGGFFSPGYPESYTSAQTCFYIISLPNEDHYVKLRFTSFDIEPSYQCVYDYIEVRDGISVISPLIGRYCGGRNNKPPKIIESTGPDIHVQFHSDVSATFDGFYAEYASSDVGFPESSAGGTSSSGDVDDVEHNRVAVCDFSQALQTERGGMIVSHASHPDGNYGVGLSCSMVIVGAESNEKVFINVLEMDLPGSTPCPGDSLTIVDGDLASVASGQNDLATLCGSRIGQYASSSNNAVVQFITDSTRESSKKGFELIYSIYYEDAYGCQGDDFHCSNERCIAESLTCDDYDHCGDNSDETRGCNDEGNGVQWTIAGIIIGGIVVMVVSASVAWIIMKNVKQPPRQQGMFDTNTLTTISGNTTANGSNGYPRSDGYTNQTYESTTAGGINAEIQQPVQQPPSYSQIFNNDPAHPPATKPSYPTQQYTMFLASGLGVGPTGAESSPNGSATDVNKNDNEVPDEPKYNPPDIQTAHTPLERAGQLPPLGGANGQRNNALPPLQGIPK